MELDHYKVIEAKCYEDPTTLKAYIEQDQVYYFFVGLKQEYNQEGSKTYWSHANYFEFLVRRVEGV